MFTGKPVIRVIDSLAEIKRGMFIRVSDGSKKPPAHHRKKVESWERTNCEKWVDDVTLSHGLIGLTVPHPDESVVIRSVSHVDFSDLKVELLTEA